MDKQMNLMEPICVLQYFHDICKIPHISGHTNELRDYCIAFAKKRSLLYQTDIYGNLIIFKEATAGYESSKGIILQGHLDMVGVKAESSNHDFLKDPILIDPEALLEGKITAMGTTLGGDDGIAIAYMLAILDDDTLEHPFIEAVFTTDEEIGLIGATHFDYSQLHGQYMLNLDSEEEGIFLTGCAGGLRSDIQLLVSEQMTEGILSTIIIEGLKGGHSGVSIGTGRGSAIVLMGRILAELKKTISYELVTIDGGVVDNAIANTCTSKIVITKGLENLNESLKLIQENLQLEYFGIEDSITINTKIDTQGSYHTIVEKDKILTFLRCAPFGVQARNAENLDFVETSLNPGIIRCNGKEFKISYAIRSSFESAKRELADKVVLLAEDIGASCTESGDYPSWTYRPNSELREHISKLYFEIYKKQPSFEIIHAGLECGVFYKNLPELDMISFGPNMKDIHTQEETLYIDSVYRVYKFLLDLIQDLK